MLILLKLFTFLSFVTLGLSGCEKEEAGSTKQTNEELITNKNWVLTGHTSKENYHPEEDQFALYEVCNTDDVYRFSNDGTFEVNEGATKCDSSDPQVVSQGTWSIKQDGLLTTETGGTAESAKIEELTHSKLVLSATESLQNNTYLQVLTFKAQ